MTVIPSILCIPTAFDDAVLGAIGAEDGALPPPVDTAAGVDVASVGKEASVDDGAAAAVVEDASDPGLQQASAPLRVQHSCEDGQP